jgi:hypothetical protein
LRDDFRTYRSHETDFPDLHRRVCFGRAGGRIIWQPRIGCWFTDKEFAGEPLPAPYTGMTIVEVYNALGVSARLYNFNACFKRVEDPRVEFVDRQVSGTDTECTVITPAGRQISVERKSPNSPMPLQLKWPVSSEEELKVAIWRTDNRAWRWDQQTFDRVMAEWGHLGAPTMFMPRVNVQDLYINTMGVENAIYALYDYPDTVKAYFRALGLSHDRLIDVINASPIEIINFGDNLHAGTLSPRLFKEFVLPVYQRRCERLHAAGKFVHSHWDGDVKGLLPFARETGLDGIEAITPKPQGDVTLEEAREALGDEMFLLDGIPAIYFDETYSVETLEECTRKAIDLFAPKLVLGISDEISSTGDIDRIRLVSRIVDEYNDGVSAR